jgi:hypothetical protein
VEGVSNLCVGKKVAHKGHIKRTWCASSESS